MKKLIFIALFFTSCWYTSDNRITATTQVDEGKTKLTEFLNRRLNTIIKDTILDNYERLLKKDSSKAKAFAAFYVGFINEPILLAPDYFGDYIYKDSIFLKKEIESIKSRLSFKKDEFKKHEVINHKNWGNYWLDRIGITINMNSEGTFFMCSNYYAEDWIFHKNMTVLVDSTTLKLTDLVNDVTKASDGVYEINYYEKEQSLNAARLINYNQNKTIKIRLSGGDYYKDFILGQRDKQGISDCYKYYILKSILK